MERHISHSMIEEELNELNMLVVRVLNAKRQANNRLFSLKFSEGMMVEWVSRKTGLTIVGKITRTNKVTAEVAVRDILGVVSWKVPFSMLKKAETYLARQA